MTSSTTSSQVVHGRSTGGGATLRGVPTRRRLLSRVLAVLVPLTLVGAAGAALPATASDTSSPRIVGGTTTTGAAHPWHVQVWGPGGSTLCGGVLVAERLVLTAAHCLPSSGDLAGYTLYAGRTALRSGGEQLTFDADAFAIAPGYEADALSDDWALIELSTAATATPLPLAAAAEESAWDAGSEAVVTGFGLIRENGSVSSTLREVTLPVLDDSTCSSSAVYGRSFDATTMLCAGDLDGGEDACSGDSGGPLQVSTDSGEVRLAGLVSWGNGCARAGYPGVYTRVAGATVREEILGVVERSTSVDPATVVAGDGTGAETGAEGGTENPEPADDSSQDSAGGSADDRRCTAARAAVVDARAENRSSRKAAARAQRRVRAARAALRSARAHGRRPAVRRWTVRLAQRRAARRTARSDLRATNRALSVAVRNRDRVCG